MKGGMWTERDRIRIVILFIIKQGFPLPMEMATTPMSPQAAPNVACLWPFLEAPLINPQAQLVPYFNLVRFCCLDSYISRATLTQSSPEFEAVSGNCLSVVVNLPSSSARKLQRLSQNFVFVLFTLQVQSWRRIFANDVITCCPYLAFHNNNHPRKSCVCF